jgi:hypothetical protein
MAPTFRKGDPVAITRGNHKNNMGTFERYTTTFMCIVIINGNETRLYRSSIQPAPVIVDEAAPSRRASTPKVRADVHAKEEGPNELRVHALIKDVHALKQAISVLEENLHALLIN